MHCFICTIHSNVIISMRPSHQQCLAQCKYNALPNVGCMVRMHSSTVRTHCYIACAAIKLCTTEAELAA